MKPKEILKIVKETFEEEVSSSSFESALGLESEVIGKDEFMKSLKTKIDKLFDEDLTKY